MPQEKPRMKRPYQKPTLVRRETLSAITALPVAVSGVRISDIRLKEDIRRVGTTAHGLPLYHFRYRGQVGVYEGVMAQDVLGVMADAVVTDADGMMRVDYGKLGVPFRLLH
jgi:Chaperone of endosialidase